MTIESSSDILRSAAVSVGMRIWRSANTLSILSARSGEGFFSSEAWQNAWKLVDGNIYRPWSQSIEKLKISDLEAESLWDRRLMIEGVRLKKVGSEPVQ